MSDAESAQHFVTFGTKPGRDLLTGRLDMRIRSRTRVSLKTSAATVIREERESA
jgi:hypothetical protein